jgi:peptide/nickel transport system ATP-binding protein
VAEPLLEVDSLTIDYLTDAGDVRAVDRVSFAVEPSEFLAVVGESGCGKGDLPRP